MPSTPPTYYLRKTAGKAQPYYWNVISAGNSKELARSSESYANKADAIASANLVRQSSGNPFEDLTDDK